MSRWCLHRRESREPGDQGHSGPIGPGARGISLLEEPPSDRGSHGDDRRGRVATTTGYELPQAILWDLLDDFVLASDGELLQAIAILIEKAHTLAEGAGAVALAGAIKYRDKIQVGKVAVVVSGGNITLDQLREVLGQDHPGIGYGGR